MFLRNGFTATGAGKDGAVQLVGAHIGGTLECDGACLVNGPAPPERLPSASRPGHVPPQRLPGHHGGDGVAINLTGTR